MATDAPVKTSVLTLTNRARTITPAEPVRLQRLATGSAAGLWEQSVVTALDPATGAILARNPWNTERRGAWPLPGAASRRSFTADRSEFLGRHGSVGRPAGLALDALSNRVGAGLDPCAALHVAVTLAPGETARSCSCSARPRRRRRAGRHRPSRRPASGRRIAGARAAQWDELLGAMSVRTPDDSFDLLLNRWLLYQTVSSRLWARSASFSRAAPSGSATSCRT